AAHPPAEALGCGSKKGARMKRVVTAVVLIPLVFAIIFFLANWLFVSAIAIVALICTFEYLRLVEKFGTPPFLITLLVVLCIFMPVIVGAVSYGHLTTLLLLPVCVVFLAPFLYLALPLASTDFAKSLLGSSLSLTGLLYICVPLMCLVVIRGIPSLGNYFLVV